MFNKTVQILSFFTLLHYSCYSQNKANADNTGTPAEVVLTPFKTTLLADEKDESVIKVTFVDKQGDEVEKADN